MSESLTNLSAPFFASIAKSSPLTMMVLNLDHQIQFINRVAPGLTIDEVLDRSVYEFVSKDQHQAMRESFAATVETREQQRYENVFDSVDGTRVFYESHVAAIVEDDQVTGFVVFSHDVTHRRLLKRAQERFFEISIDPMCMADDKGNLLQVNHAMAQLIGWSAHDLVGQSMYDFIHEDDRDHSRRAFDVLPADGGATDIENRILAADQTERSIHWRATYDDDTHTIFVVARDNTEREAMQHQLQQAQKMEAVGQLAGGVAHDFNNLLLAIMGNTDFALLHAEDSHELQEHLREIKQACERAKDLTQQLLAFSRQREVNLVELSLNSLIQNVLGMLGRLLPAYIELEFIPGHRLALVEADAGQIEQVLLNLCVNARDALEGTGRITIETENVIINGRYRETHPWAKPGRYVLLTVSDNGSGMGPDTKLRAFEPFFTTKPLGKGTGLGLATVYGIVRNHDGFVHIYSEPGQGTSVKVYLPAAVRFAAEIGPKIESDSVAGARGHVLLAEDQPLVRSVIAKILDHAGYDVSVTTNGYEALRKLRAQPERYDLALLDVVTPELGGIEAYARMCDIRPDLPVLFMSGYSEVMRDEDDELPLLKKPFTSDALLSRVSQILGEGDGESGPDGDRRNAGEAVKNSDNGSPR